MRSVVVTGASRGFGLAIAERLVRDGFRVVAIARQPSDELIAAQRAAPAGALAFVPFDLVDTAGIAGLARRLRQQFGPLYGLVNNAAIGPAGLLATMRDRDIAETLHLDVLSPLILTKYVSRSMLAAGEGRIVNIASVAALTGHDGLSVYSAGKAALIGFTRALARELGPAGITVNAVAPGFAETRMTAALGAAERERIARRTPLRRLVKPGDVAEAVAFLCGAGAANITGTVITVDAGATA